MEQLRYSPQASPEHSPSNSSVNRLRLRVGGRRLQVIRTLGFTKEEEAKVLGMAGDPLVIDLMHTIMPPGDEEREQPEYLKSALSTALQMVSTSVSEISEKNDMQVSRALTAAKTEWEETTKQTLETKLNEQQRQLNAEHEKKMNIRKRTFEKQLARQESDFCDQTSELRYNFCREVESMRINLQKSVTQLQNNVKESALKYGHGWTAEQQIEFPPPPKTHLIPEVHRTSTDDTPEYPTLNPSKIISKAGDVISGEIIGMLSGVQKGFQKFSSDQKKSSMIAALRYEAIEKIVSEKTTEIDKLKTLLREKVLRETREVQSQSTMTKLTTINISVLEDKVSQIKGLESTVERLKEQTSDSQSLIAILNKKIDEFHDAMARTYQRMGRLPELGISRKVGIRLKAIMQLLPACVKQNIQIDDSLFDNLIDTNSSDKLTNIVKTKPELISQQRESTPPQCTGLMVVDKNNETVYNDSAMNGGALSSPTGTFLAKIRPQTGGRIRHQNITSPSIASVTTKAVSADRALLIKYLKVSYPSHQSPKSKGGNKLNLMRRRRDRPIPKILNITRC